MMMICRAQAGHILLLQIFTEKYFTQESVIYHSFLQSGKKENLESF